MSGSADDKLGVAEQAAKALVEHLVRSGAGRTIVAVKVNGTVFRVICQPEGNAVLADILYTEYCKAVGGKAHDGVLLPNWTEFRADPAKTRQADAWEVVAKTAVAYCRD
jgi:hypothetical protein